MRTNRTIIAIVLLLASLATGCFAPATVIRTADPPCGTYKGHDLYKGPKGGCYYFNSRGNKTYIDRELCDCDGA